MRPITMQKLDSGRCVIQGDNTWDTRKRIPALISYNWRVLVLVLRRPCPHPGIPFTARRAQARGLRVAAAGDAPLGASAGQRDRPGEGRGRRAARKPGGAGLAGLSGLRADRGGAHRPRYPAGRSSGARQGGSGARLRSEHRGEGAEPAGRRAGRAQTQRDFRFRRFGWPPGARLAARPGRAARGEGRGRVHRLPLVYAGAPHLLVASARRVGRRRRRHLRTGGQFFRLGRRHGDPQGDILRDPRSGVLEEHGERRLRAGRRPSTRPGWRSPGRPARSPRAWAAPARWSFCAGRGGR